VICYQLSVISYQLSGVQSYHTDRNCGLRGTHKEFNIFADGL